VCKLKSLHDVSRRDVSWVEGVESRTLERWVCKTTEGMGMRMKRM
jgi:hypothetical protein